MDPELVALIKRHEGLKLKAYRDSLGNWTIGYGHLMVKNHYLEISQDQAEQIFKEDLAGAVADFHGLFPYPKWFTKNRKNALIDMIYQLGITKFRHFKKAIAHIDMGRWPEASRELLDSLWAKQTPERAAEIAQMVLEG